MPNDTSLLLTTLGCILATVLPKILPITFVDGDSMPTLFRKWLSFVPVAVMAALVGSDVFFYEGKFSLGIDNLYLLVSLPVLLLAWVTKNYFLPIAAGIGLVIVARASGFF